MQVRTATDLSDRLVMKPITALSPYAGNARTHSKKQIKQIARSIERFGFVNPVLISDDDQIVAGHGRVLAAKQLGMTNVPTLALSHLNEAERQAYVLADNKLAENAGWDKELLAIELQHLIELDFEVELTGFEIAEIDLIIEEADGSDDKEGNSLDDVVPEPNGLIVSKPDDIWNLGQHRLICGDARDEHVIAALLDGRRPHLMFTDPPYNVKIDGNVCGLGSVTHKEFAFASGEMSVDEFTAFLTKSLGASAAHLQNGAIAFVCMDWRHMRELLDAGETVFDELKNLIVWNKSNGGMGAFYRSKHELIFAFKKGTAAHTNSFGLGSSGRYRTNVWDYPGISSLGTERDEALAMHPTVKPVAMIVDAIKDCSRRGEIVIDCFAGSGSTLIAAEKSGRKAMLVEYEPTYCDTIIRRWQAYTGNEAIRENDGRTFDEAQSPEGSSDSDVDRIGAIS